MIQILETERLFLRRFDLNDTSFIIELLNTPGWLEFIGDKKVKTHDEAITYLQDGPLKSYKANGFGLSLVALKEDYHPIGMCGLIKRPTLEKIDIGFAFLPTYNGMGYAYEIAQEIVNYGKNHFHLDEIVAITIPANVRSIKLLNKLGFYFKKMVNNADEKEELLLFSNVAQPERASP